MSNNYYLLFAFFPIIFICINLNAQLKDYSRYYIQLNENIVILKGDEIKNNYESTIRNKLIFTLGGTALSFLIDNALRENLQLKSSKNDQFMMKIGHAYGDFYFNFYLSSALLLTNFILNDKRIAATGKILFESLIFATLINITIKYIIGRSRPYEDEGNLKFNWFETENSKNSLPSGHVVTAFSTSTVLSLIIDNTYISMILYGLAGLTAYQRISSDNHWFSDVFLGASIGYLCGEFFYERNKNLFTEGDKLNLIPFFYGDKAGILFSFNF